MKILKEQGLTFDDVLLVPQYSEVHSRGDINLSTNIGKLKLDIPIISANMDSVTEATMAIEMSRLGGLGILHRYMDQTKIEEQLYKVRAASAKLVPSIGVQREDNLLANWYANSGVSTICIDVAHGDSRRCLEMITYCKKLGLHVIAGNVCTPVACRRMIDAGADVIKVGVGNGSLCVTRIVTGHGYPQFSAIMECADAIDGAVSLIADGGIRNAGDIVKCLAAGADAVMIGGPLAGCLETPGAIKEGKKVYRGMASLSAQMDRDGKVHNDCPEGESMTVLVRGRVEDVIKELLGGIRSGLSYSGSRDIGRFQRDAIMVRVSSNCTKENGAHGKKD
jgi:IMP dehydrogenase